MLKNYLKIAFRSLRRHKGFTVLTVTSLVLGFTCCLLILLYVQDERSYDRFHEQADHSYRVAVERTYPDRVVQSATTPRPLAAALAADLPEVRHATRLSTERADRVLIRYGDQHFFEDRVFFADANIFDVFTFPLLRGDAQTALADPFSIVLTESRARKYFGEADPLGRLLTLRLSGDRTSFDYRVTGVARDVPAQSHVRFDVLASYDGHPNVGADEDQRDWLGLDLYTYVRLQDDAHPDVVTAKLPGLVQTYAHPQVEELLGTTPEAFATAGNRFRYFLQPLTDIHLHSHLQGEIEPNSDITYVYLFAAIALFILLIAGINFMNLSTARSAGRAREVGVRKVLGSQRHQLVRRFLAESMLLTILAFLLALALVELTLPVFNAFVGKNLATRYLDEGSMLTGLTLFALVTGLLAGAYPALYLSAFRPAVVLKSTNMRLGRRSTLRNSLVVFQFAVSITLVVGTLVVANQMEYVRTKKLGFAKEQVVLIEGTEVLGPRIEAFKTALREHAGIVSVANGQTVPGRSVGRTLLRAEGAPDEARRPLSWMTVGFSYPETLGLTVLEGRPFSPAFATDSMAVLLNQAAVRALDLTDPVGKIVLENDRAYTIVGVVDDFHFASLHQTIGPFVLFGPDPWNDNRPNQVVLARTRLTPRLGELTETLAALEATWQAFAPEQPFTYTFLDTDFDAHYQADQRTGQLIGYFAALAILIACLGVFGLAAFTAEQRTKEIGIRKVLGASVPGIIVLLSKDYLQLVVFSFVLAAPFAYVIMNQWLAAFAYRIDLSWPIFLLAGVAALGVALLTVSYQAIRAALADPVKALRYE